MDDDSLFRSLIGRTSDEIEELLKPRFKLVSEQLQRQIAALAADIGPPLSDEIAAWVQAGHLQELWDCSYAHLRRRH